MLFRPFVHPQLIPRALPHLIALGLPLLSQAEVPCTQSAVLSFIGGLETGIVLLAFGDTLIERGAIRYFDAFGLVVPVIPWSVGNAPVDEVFEEFSVGDRFLWSSC